MHIRLLSHAIYRCAEITLQGHCLDLEAPCFKPPFQACMGYNCCQRALFSSVENTKVKEEEEREGDRSTSFSSLGT